MNTAHLTCAFAGGASDWLVASVTVAPEGAGSVDAGLEWTTRPPAGGTLIYVCCVKVEHGKMIKEMRNNRSGYCTITGTKTKAKRGWVKRWREYVS